MAEKTRLSTTRRHVLLGTGAAGMGLLLPGCSDGGLLGGLGPDREAMRAAFLYSFGPYEYARSLSVLANGGRASEPVINEFRHVRRPADHTSRRVTTPNSDTIYSSAALDLSAGPVRITVPATGDRYLSVALTDIFLDVFAVLRPPDDGSPGANYLIVPPRWEGETPSNATIVRSTSNDVWALGRTFVAGPDDLQAAQSAQSGLSIAPLQELREVPAYLAQELSKTPGVNAYLDATNELLSRSPDHTQVRRASQFADLGLGPSPTATGMLVETAWKRTLEQGPKTLKEAVLSRLPTKGWSKPPANLAAFEEDDAARAATALIGFGALPRSEAVYLTSIADAQGDVLDGSNEYLFKIEGDVPTDAFWSISVYRSEADGRQFFFENPTGRHSLNGSSPELARHQGNDITINLSATKPDEGVWMPLPKGQFRFVFRIYRPTTEATEGNWEPQPLTKVS